MKCPECGMEMWREGAGFLKHPVPSRCRYAGMAFTEKTMPKPKPAPKPKPIKTDD
jgi:hypothetical protein